MDDDLARQIDDLGRGIDAAYGYPPGSGAALVRQALVAQKPPRAHVEFVDGPGCCTQIGRALGGGWLWGVFPSGALPGDTALASGKVRTRLGARIRVWWFSRGRR